MSSKSKIIKNLISSIGGKILLMAVAIVLPRLYIVGYGSQVNGLLSSVDQLLIYMSLFEAGVAKAATQALYGPVARKDWRSISGIISAANQYYRRTGVVYGTVLVLLAVGYPLVVETGLPFGVTFGVIIFSGLGGVVQFFLQGKYMALLWAEGKDYVKTNLHTLVNTLNCVVKIVLIRMGVSVVVTVAAGFFIHFIQAIYIYVYVRRNYRQLDLSVPPDREAIGQKNFVLAHQISALIFNNTDVLLLTLFCDLRLVSVYTVFRMITSNLEGFLGYTAGSVNFVLGQNFKMDRELYVRRLDTLENFYSALVYAVFSVALFLMLPFMRLYTAGISDANYVDGTLAVLFVVMTLLSQTRMPMQMAIEHSGHFKQTAGRSMLEATINLIVSLLAVNRWGIYGVLVGTIAALLYRTNDILVYSNRKILQRSPWRSYKVYGLNIALFVGMTVLYPRLFSGPIDSYWHFALVGAAATVLALVVFVGGQLLCFPLCRQQLKAIQEQIKGKLGGRKA